ncbi:hypothetical protein BGZ72_001122 [Mortierella alpina]|nr:hypothetical protein BGZ72_001122 [Mortierella alpina]
MPLPTTTGGSIGKTFGNPKTFCSEKDLIKGAEAFPQNFIISSEVKEWDGYVQVTGVMNRTVYGWNENDQGIKFHPGYPSGLTCSMYKGKLENKLASNFGFIEPNREHFCFRCCHGVEHCDILNKNAKESGYRTCQGNFQGSYTRPKPPVTPTPSQTTHHTSGIASSTTGTSTSTGTGTPTSPGNAASALSRPDWFLSSAIFFAARLAL